MKAWEEIINKALLGSEKASLSSADLPAGVAGEYEIVASPDKEEMFLKIAAVAYQYRQAGARPFHAGHVKETQAAPEVKSYCSVKANVILKALLEEELYPLLNLWLRLCAINNQLVKPEVLPSLLDLAKRKKELRQAVVQVAGERGKWLAALNPGWNFAIDDADPKVVWDEESTDQRKDILRHLRTLNPEEGRRLLESSWATEGANEKLAFIDILKTNSSEADLPWLESLEEKAQKVNAAILEVLKVIPSSSVVQEYQKVLAACVSLKTGKALLGMINKSTIEVNESYPFPEVIFKTGIEKLSSDKKTSDSRHIAAQLVMSVPPSFWAHHFERTPAEIVELFQKQKQSAFYLPAVAIASVRFNDATWSRVILEKADKEIISSSIAALLSQLSHDDRNKYALKYFEEQPAEIIRVMLSSDGEWTVDLTKAILRFTAREVYQYNKTFYRQAVALMPVSIVDMLDSFGPNEEQKKPYWQTQRDELARLLTLKQQTLQSFNP